jgi:hypothetical protein
MPIPPTPSRYRGARRALPAVLVALVAAAPLVVGGSAGCSRHGAAAEEEDAAAPAFDAARPDAADATPPPDAKTEEERLALADAGRFCGAKDLPDCPLQLWMKENASTMLGFGEITTLAEVFDRIALLAPPQMSPKYDYPNWDSIAKDGASAARLGNLTAAKAACRGCHSQYQRTYHATFRGLPLHSLPRAPEP